MEGSNSKGPLGESEQLTEDGLVIETRSLVKDYIDGTNIIHALRGADLKIYRGEMVAIMGPSGSGKSTLLHVLGLLHAPTAGVYLFKGHNILNFTPQEQALFRSKEVGFIFQSCDLLPNSTVYENLELPLIYASSEKRTRRKKILEALDKVGLSHRADHWANHLSGGERQRAAMARALVNDPSLILGDEPTGQLDQKNTDAVVEQLRSVARQGYTVVVVTHEEEIGRACDRVIRIRDGKVASDGLENLEGSEVDSEMVAVIEMENSEFQQITLRNVSAFNLNRVAQANRSMNRESAQANPLVQTEAKKIHVNAKEFLASFRDRSDDYYLMGKFSLKPEHLRKIYHQLMERGLLAEYEYNYRDRKSPEVEQTVESRATPSPASGSASTVVEVHTTELCLKCNRARRPGHSDFCPYCEEVLAKID